MNPKRAEQYEWLLKRKTPVFGWALRRLAAAALALSPAPSARRLLADELSRCEDADFRGFMAALLRRVTNPDSILAVCEAWARSRHPELASLMADRSWVPSEPGQVRVLAALKTNRTNLLIKGGRRNVEHLVAACDDFDPDIASRARRCLLEINDQDTLTALCSFWVNSRNSVCADVIRARALVAVDPPRARVLTALINGRLDLLKGVEAEYVGPLSEAAFDSDIAIRKAARSVLGQLENADAREAVCRLFCESGSPVYRGIVGRSGFVPRDTTERALFFFLTEQWEKYLELDFDQSLLGAQFEHGTPRIRSRIAETARQAGRAEWITVIRGGQQDRRLSELTEEEWDAALTVMRAGSRWKEMWQLAQVAPADWGTRLTHCLREACWRPSEPSELAVFTQLILLGQSCRGEPPFLGRLIRSGAFVGAHRGKVACLEVAWGRQLAASAGEDGTIKLWDLSGRNSVRTLPGHAEWIGCAGIDPDERLLATGSADGTVRLWDLASGESMGVMQGHTGEVRCLTFSADGSIVASGGGDATIRLWKVGKSVPMKTLAEHIDHISCLSVSPDGGLLASGSYDDDIRLWSLPDGELVGRLSGHRAMVNALAFDPRGALLISGAKDRSVILWDVPARRLLRRLKGHRDDVYCLAVSSDGQTVASGSWDTTIRLWRLDDGELLDTLGRSRTNDGHSSWVTCLSFSPDGRVLASGSADRSVRLWSAPGGAPLKVLEGHDDRVVAIRFSPDGRELVSGGWDGKILLWKSELARLRRTPIGETTLEDLDWVETTLSNSRLLDSERHWLEFLVALMRWRRRYDVQLGDAARITVGEFDIEIAG